MTTFHSNKLYKEIAQDIIDRIDDYEGTRDDEIHNNLYNTDYYIIGTYEAKKWLEKYDTFRCISYVKEYEEELSGEVHTDLTDPEKIVNMLVYIIGEEILSITHHLTEKGNILNKREIKDIKKFLNYQWEL